MRFLDRVSSLSPARIRVLGFAMVVLLGCLDFLTPKEISISLFYLIPIVFVSWYDRTGYGFFMAVVSTGSWIVADVLSGLHATPVVFFWNSVNRLAVYSIVVWMLGSLRKSHRLRYESELEKYSRIVEAAGEGVMALDNRGIVRYVNSRITQMLGYSSGELVGKSQAELVTHEGSRMMTDLHRGSDHATDARLVEVRLARKDGGECWALVRSPVLNEKNGTEGTVLLLTDISEWKYAEEELRRQYKQISAMQHLSSMLAQSVDREKRMENALRTVLTVARFEAGAIYLLDEEEKQLVLHCHIGFDPDSEGFPRNHSFAHNAAGQADLRQALFVEDVEHSPPLISPLRVVAGTKGFASIPLIAADTILGVLHIMDRSRYAFPPDERPLLQTLGRQIGVALENARLYEAARDKARHIQRLSIDLIRIQEEERKRFARELHDGLAQVLMTMRVNAELALGGLGQTNGRARHHLREVIALITEAEHEAKQISYDLRPAILDDFGLKAAIEVLARNFDRRAGIGVDLHLPDRDLRFDSIIETTIYRIVQELLANVQKHSGAKLVTIQLLVRSNVLALTVADNGRGFNARNGLQRSTDQPHNGLRNIRERIESLRGTFRIESSEQRGTECMVEVPCIPLNMESPATEKVLS
jgi:PAS domain S-box-containing protein